MRRELVALEDVERLADGRAAARGRAHPVDVEAAVADVGRRPLRRAVAAQVGDRHHARPPEWFGVRRDRRVRDGVDDRLRDLAAVEALRPAVREQRVGAGEVGVAEDRADVARRAVRIEVERGGRRDVVEEVTFAWIWSEKVWSTTKPSRATRSPARALRRARTCRALSARSQPATVPGTPTERPL